MSRFTSTSHPTLDKAHHGGWRATWATARYVVGDVLASAVAWTTLYLYRKQELEMAPAFRDALVPGGDVDGWQLSLRPDVRSDVLAGLVWFGGHAR